MSEVQKSYEEVRAEIGNAPVVLVAVSKKQSLEKIGELYELGHRDFGENYVQELLAKAKEATARGWTSIHWHLIGHLQTNKVKMLLVGVPGVEIQSVDSVRLAAEIQKQASLLGVKSVRIWVEVNVSGAESKSGVAPESLSEILKKLKEFDKLSLVGLMCIPSQEQPEKGFQLLRSLREQHLGGQGGLSMGMSEDFGLAIRSGSTCVRVGTRIFGARGV